VDDGSNDQTFAIACARIAAVDRRRVTVVKLRRNFGQTAGLAAGFDHGPRRVHHRHGWRSAARSQRHPLVPGKDWPPGYDIVSGWRKVRVDNFWMRRIPSRIANWMMAKISGVDIHDFGTTFKAYRRDIPRAGPALRRTAPLYSRAGLVGHGANESVKLAIRNREPRTRGFRTTASRAPSASSSTC